MLLKHRTIHLMLLAVCGLLLLAVNPAFPLFDTVTPVAAQLGNDPDGDGIIDDDCPTIAGPRENRGCPIPTEYDPDTADGDQDGLVDALDFCDQDPGPLDNGGCPLPEEDTGDTPPESDTNVPKQPLPTLPGSDGLCMAATQDAVPVNLRDFPSLTATVIGALDPYQIYPVLMMYSTPEGLWLRTYGGWFAGWVTRRGGNCANLPQFDTGNTPTNLLTDIERTPYQNVADLPLKILRCEGGLVGVLFGEGIRDSIMDENGDCVVLLTGEHQLIIPANGNMGHTAEDGIPVESWSWGATNENTYLPLSCATLVHIIEPVEGTPFVGLFTAAHCLDDGDQAMWPTEGTPLGDLITEGVWMNFFDDFNPDPAPVGPDGSADTRLETEVNFGWQLCTDLYCSAAIVTDLPIPGILVKHLTDCVAITIDQLNSTVPPWQLTYTLPGDPCPGGHWRGATIGLSGFIPSYPESLISWLIRCNTVPITGDNDQEWYYFDPITYTLDWNRSEWEGKKVQCRFTFYPDWEY